MKKLNRISLIFIISIILLFFFIFVSLQGKEMESDYFGNEASTDFSNNWRINVNGEMIAPIALPAKLDLKPNDTITLEKSLPMSLQSNTTICFRSSQQKVKVFIDKELIYSYGYNDLPPYGNSPGSIWNVIRLNPAQSGKTITIELSSPCADFSGCINTITTGTKSALLFNILRHNSTTLIAGVMLIFTGIVLLLLLIVLKVHMQVPILSQSLLFLALFSIILGIWVSIESRLLSFFFNDVFIAHYLNFLTIACAPVALQLYLLHTKSYKGDKVLQVLLALGLINVWLLFILQALEILDFTNTLRITHIIIVCTAVYLIYLEIKSFILHSRPYASIANTFALVTLIAGCAIDFFLYYFNPAHSIAKFVSLGLLSFMVILMLESFIEFFSIKKEVNRTQLLKELAYMDSLTQLGNRTAYEEALEDYQQKIRQTKKLAIFIADINELKNINDTFGHSAGDIAISTSGTALKHIFGNWGKAYRIGGDEFCVICEDLTNEKCEYLCNEFKKEMENNKISYYNANDITVQLSLGYAFYDNTETRLFSIQELVKRADNAMYAHKLNKNNNSMPKLRRDTIEMKRIEF